MLMSLFRFYGAVMVIFLSYYNCMNKLSTTEDEGNDLSEYPSPPKAEICYGNLTVYCRGKVHISLGPDYPFTKIALIFILAFTYGAYLLQKSIDFGVVGRVIGLLIIFLPLLSFLYTSFANPGIYNESENDEPKIKYCEFCKVFKPKNVYHCETCNVCIEGYDHHCPWISKCVGRKNIKGFYVLLISTLVMFIHFGYLVYRAFTKEPQP